MARKNRIKRPYAVYHIIMRGMSDLPLFRNDKDKNSFLTILKKYKNIYRFKVYEYCILNTHVHLMVDSNGADISDFMKSVNQSYAIYYNKIYKRRGPVFGNRYYSRITLNDYDILNVSAYIHNNPKDIKGYEKNVANYKFSSLGIYMGQFKDDLELIDSDFILGYWGKDLILSRVRLISFVKSRHSKELIEPVFNINELENNNLDSTFREARNSIIRKFDYLKVINFICESLQIQMDIIKTKHSRKASEYRSFIVLMLKVFSNLGYTEISKILVNYSVSSISSQFTRGYNLTQNNSKYKALIQKFVNKFSTNNTQFTILSS